MCCVMCFRMCDMCAAATTQQGYTYNFVSEANKKAFLKSPSTYVPQFGGFCSYGISSETW